MYNAIDLSLFEMYTSLEMRINKYIFGFIVLHVLHIVFVYILWSVCIFIHSILAIYSSQVILVRAAIRFTCLSSFSLTHFLSITNT